MLVCKSWKVLFQDPLYKDVILYDNSRIKKFIATTRENERLSSLVKTLNFQVSTKYPCDVIQSTLNTLFHLLPGVERIDFHFETYYRFLLNAVRLNHLPNLKYVSPPTYEPPIDKREIEGYFKSVFILKHRLENLAIVDYDERRRSEDLWSIHSSDNVGEDSDYEEITSVRGDFLLENLHQFKNIQELQIKKNCEDKFEMIEKVTRDCTTVRKLSLEFNTDYASRDTDSPSLNFLPASNVKDLKYSGTLLSNMRLLNYIMDKFPQLGTLEIDDAIRPWNCMDKNKLNKFLNYLLRIRKVTTSNIACEEEIMQETIAPFWSIVTRTHLLEVEFSYPTTIEDFREKTMDINIEDEVFMNRFHFPSDPATTGLKLASYIEQFGHHIDHLSLSHLQWDLLDPSRTKKTRFEFLVLHPLKCCDKLTKLSLVGCSMAGLDVKGYEVYKKQTFDTLSFSYCGVEEDGFFETISRLFGSIKNLILWESIQWSAPENDSVLGASINMMETDIESLIIIDSHGSMEAVLLVNLLQGKSHTYYMYDLSMHYGGFVEFVNFKTISNKEYYKKLCHHECVTIDISCKSLQALGVVYAGVREKLETF